MFSTTSSIKDDIKIENDNYHHFNKLISTSFKYLKVNAKYLNNNLLKKLVQKIWDNILDYNMHLHFVYASDVRIYKFHKYLRLSDNSIYYNRNRPLMLIRIKHGFFSKKVVRNATLSDVLAFISGLEKQIDNYHTKRILELDKKLAKAKSAQENLEHIAQHHNSWDDLYKETDKDN